MKRFRRRLTATGCIAAALLFAACSANDDASNDGVPAAVTPDASTTVLESSGTMVATLVSTVPPATPADEPTSTTMLSFTGDADSDWCAVAAQLVVLSDAFEAASVSDPDELERTLTAFVDRMALITFIAPPEIVDDVALSVGAFGDMWLLLEAVEFNLSAADLSTIDARRETLETSSNRIATYNRDVCGLHPDAVATTVGAGVTIATVVSGSVASTSSTSVAATEPGRAAAIDLLISSGYTAEEAECIVNEIENGLRTQEVLSACGVSLEGSTP